jgi:uncharacterized protein YceH (UPF0502 family)
MASQAEQPKTSRRGGRGRPRSRPLRGEMLVKAAKAELGRMATLSPKTDPINVSNLSKRLGVTRQAIYNNGLEKDVAEYAELQRTNFSASVEAVATRRPLEERIAHLEKELAEFRERIDGWIEKWATVEYNAKMLGIDADQLFAPMPPPERR